MNRFDKHTHYAPDSSPENLADNDKLSEFGCEVRTHGRRTGVVEQFWGDKGRHPAEVTNEIEWTDDDLNRLIDEIFVTTSTSSVEPMPTRT